MKRDMDKVISIYEAKTHFSKLVQQAQAGKTIYVGAYGQPQAVIAPLPARRPLVIGVWAHKRRKGAYRVADLVGPDADVQREFDDSLDRPLP